MHEKWSPQQLCELIRSLHLATKLALIYLSSGFFSHIQHFLIKLRNPSQDISAKYPRLLYVHNFFIKLYRPF